MTEFSFGESKFIIFPLYSVQCGKMRNSLPRKFFSSNQSTVKLFSIKTLIWRKFLQKSVAVKFRNFHSVTGRVISMKTYVTSYSSNLITILLSRNIFNGCWWSVSIIFIYVVRSCLISCNTFYQNSFQDSNPVKFSLFFTVSFSRNKWMTFEKFHEFAKTWV